MLCWVDSGELHTVCDGISGQISCREDKLLEIFYSCVNNRANGGGPLSGMPAWPDFAWVAWNFEFCPGGIF